MGVFGAGVDAQVSVLAAAELVLGQHAAHGVLNDALGALLEHFLERRLTQAAEVAGVAVVDFLLELAAGDGDLCGVDDDDVVADILRGVEGGLVFAAQEGGDLGGEASERALGGVDHVPAALDVTRVEDSRRHGQSSIWAASLDRSERRPRSNPSGARWARQNRGLRR